MSQNSLVTRCLRQLPNALTLGNALAGLAAVLLFFARAAEGDTLGAISLAFALLALGVACDTLDGPLARLLKANDPLGAQLDSLADAATFGFAAAAILAGCVWSLSPALALVLAGCWLSAALLRLARFNLNMDIDQPHLYFSGLCSPVAALYLLALLLCAELWPAVQALALGMSLVLPLLMLSRLRFADLPKHYLSRKRAPWDLVIAVAAMFFLEPALVVVLYLSVFLVQSLLENLRARPSGSPSNDLS